MKILRESWLDWYSTHSKYSTEKREKLEENLKVCENLAYVSPNLDPELNIAADVARIVWLVPLVHDFLYTGLPFQTAVILIHHRAIVSTYASYATNCSSLFEKNTHSNTIARFETTSCTMVSWRSQFQETMQQKYLMSRYFLKYARWWYRGLRIMAHSYEIDWSILKRTHLSYFANNWKINESARECTFHVSVPALFHVMSSSNRLV